MKNNTFPGIKIHSVVNNVHNTVQAQLAQNVNSADFF